MRTMRARVALLGMYLASGCALFRGNPYEGASQEERTQFRHINLPLSLEQPFEVRASPFSTKASAGDEYHWVFTALAGGMVTAAEGGTVYKLYPRSDSDPCKRGLRRVQDVAVEHHDGTIAFYAGIEAGVRAGSVLQRGDPIGRIGVTDRPCDFRFSVYKSRYRMQDTTNPQSIPLWFEQVPGGVLVQGFRLSDRFD